MKSQKPRKHDAEMGVTLIVIAIMLICVMAAVLLYAISGGQ